jgi:hypothetical protein
MSRGRWFKPATLQTDEFEMDETPTRPPEGWWLALDGHWYPPEQSPIASPELGALWTVPPQTAERQPKQHAVKVWRTVAIIAIFVAAILAVVLIGVVH